MTQNCDPMQCLNADCHSGTGEKDSCLKCSDPAGCCSSCSQVLLEFAALHCFAHEAAKPVPENWQLVVLVVVGALLLLLLPPPLLLLLQPLLQPFLLLQILS